MSNGVNQCAACGGLWDDDEPHAVCPSDPCPDPSICDRHNCAAAAAYCDGVADERERAAERVAAAYRLAWDTSQDAPEQSVAVAAARGGDA